MKKEKNSERLAYYKELFGRAEEVNREDRERLGRLWRLYKDGGLRETSESPYNTLLRNFVYELIESQVDSSVPPPKVTSPSREPRKVRNAKIIEAMLRDAVKYCRMQAINDEDERVVKALGGVYSVIEWDGNGGYNQCGRVSVRSFFPTEVIPQPGITSLADADYFFTVKAMTKKRISHIYGVELEDNEVTSDVNSSDLRLTEEPEEKNEEEVIRVITAYYRNGHGRLGLFSWAAGSVLEDNEDYNARSEEICVTCGRSKPMFEDECECGCREWERRPAEYEELGAPIERQGEEGVPDIIPAFTVQEAEDGGYINVPTKIPYYTPKELPIILRKNVSAFGQLLGDSDCEKIEKLQLSHNNLALKVQEKLMKGGSLLTLPKGVRIEASDRECKLVRLDQPSQLSMISAVNLQPNIQQDLQMLSKYYEDARSTLGITDSYQGKPDRTADSGAAKQAQIAQASGRLESKIYMKNQAYIDRYRIMFQYILAYTDEKVDVVVNTDSGESQVMTFDRYEFLRQTASGDWVWDDDYIFDIDSAGGLFNNRHAMWQEIRTNLQSGAYGAAQDPETLLIFWKQMEAADYPNASIMVSALQQKTEQQQAQQQQMQQQAQQQMQQGQQAQTPPEPPMNTELLERVNQFIKE